MKPAAFLDRDGVVIEEGNYISKIEEVFFLPKTIDAIKLLNVAGYFVVITTNQSGIARGLFTEKDLNKIHEYINFSLQKYGAKIDFFYYCPHHPTEGKGVYKKNCECRKPNSGMFFKAVRENNIDISRSFLVGDKISDIETGKKIGIASYLVNTGYGMREYEKIKDKKLFENNNWFYVKSLWDAVKQELDKEK